jgi:hypothetical protein
MANDKSKPKAFIVCIRLKDADNIGKYHDDAYVALKQNAGSFDLMISKTVELKEGESPLPLGIFKATGTGSIDNLNAVANSAARSGMPDFVAVFEITDSLESIRLSYHDRATATKTKPRTSSP